MLQRCAHAAVRRASALQTCTRAATGPGVVLASQAPPSTFVRGASADELARARDAILGAQSPLFVTGAGISSESGIPAFRGPHLKKDDYKPIIFSAFTSSAELRQRYWARSFLGWPRMQQAKPNTSHHALAQFERSVPGAMLITQNVDSLHRTAGSRDVLELHGHLRAVRSMTCGWEISRASMQALLRETNPAWAPFERAALDALTAARPDGDADLGARMDPRSFVVPDCASVACPSPGRSPGARTDGAAAAVPGAGAASCVLKPTIVFYGESVPRVDTERSLDMASRADVLVVLGSTLSTYSAYRLVKLAHERGIPVVVVNVGPTRADTLSGVLRIDGLLSHVLPQILNSERG